MLQRSTWGGGITLLGGSTTLQRGERSLSRERSFSFGGIVYPMPPGLKRLLKKSLSGMARGLMPAREIENKGLVRRS